MERIVSFEPGFDRRAEGYGVGAMRLRFVLKGELGAVQFLLGTNWYPRHVQEAEAAKGLDLYRGEILPTGWDIGYHSPRPMYEGQTPMGPCEYLDGKPCYYDGSSLAADPIRDAFLERGEPAVWEACEERYVETFGELR
jgi:hypothetical protein